MGAVWYFLEHRVGVPRLLGSGTGGLTVRRVHSYSNDCVWHRVGGEVGSEPPTALTRQFQPPFGEHTGEDDANSWWGNLR